MTNPVTRRPIRVGEVPSSNLGAPIKSPASAGFFLAGTVLLAFAIGQWTGSKGVCDVSVRLKATCLQGFLASALFDEFGAVFGC
jgi:hypothetical protein